MTGCHTAVRHFLERERRGAIVNVSSHQAQRAVTRAAAVDHGPDGIRCNAVALGSIRTDRYDAYRDSHPDVDVQMAGLHPLGRVGEAAEVAAVVAFLMSEESSFVNGAVIPVGGGRAAQGADPEAT